MEFLEAQFRHPSGFLGIVAGKIMAVSNRSVARWTISLLGIRPGDRVLEVSFGPGVALHHVAALLKRDGLAVGVDPSLTMVNEARKRNRSAIAAGCIALQEATVSHLPLRDNTFEKAFSINSIQVWPDIEKNLQEVRRTLKPDGLLAISFQARSTRAEKARAGKRRRLADYIEEAGFYDVQCFSRSARPMPALCVIGKKSARSARQFHGALSEQDGMNIADENSEEEP